MKVTQRQLLIILPRLHSELDIYSNSFVCFDKPALPSLSKYWLPPFDKETSPYGVDVMKTLEHVAKSLDQCILNKCLKDICKQAAVTLKRQRGDAYGFGDRVDSPDAICKNLSEEMLDDPEATNTKKIENYLGNLDRIITTTGPQRFDKASDDLVLKYGNDIILDSNMKWTSRETRKAAKELLVLQKSFKEKQETLKSHGLDDADVAVVTTTNRIQRVVTQCKKSHSGPLSDISELHDIVKKFSINNDSEKKLHAILNLEVRYRKFTMTNVKDVCPLFRQKGLTVAQKVKNLELLLESQSIGFTANATMDDLESAVMYDDNNADENEQATLQTVKAEAAEIYESEVANEIPKADAATTSEVVEQVISSFWPPKEAEFVCALLEDGFYIGQVDKVKDEQLYLIYLVPKSSDNRQYWVWPEREDKDWIGKEYIMEIYPSLSITSKLSTKRKVVYELMNEEIINAIIQFC